MPKIRKSKHEKYIPSIKEFLTTIEGDDRGLYKGIKSAFDEYMSESSIKSAKRTFNVLLMRYANNELSMFKVGWLYEAQDKYKQKLKTILGSLLGQSRRRYSWEGDRSTYDLEDAIKHALVYQQIDELERESMLVMNRTSSEDFYTHETLPAMWTTERQIEIPNSAAQKWQKVYLNCVGAQEEFESSDGPVTVAAKVEKVEKVAPESSDAVTGTVFFPEPKKDAAAGAGAGFGK